MAKRKLTGSVQVKKDMYYVVLNTYVEGKRKPTWIPTDIPVKTKVNEKRAGELLLQYLEEYSNKVDSPKQIDSLQGKETVVTREITRVDATEDCGKGLMFTDLIYQWLENKKLDIDTSTWEAYEICVRTHLVPYFKALNLSVEEVTAWHIKKYYDFKTNGGRMDGKPGGLSYVAIKKHASVLRMVFAEAILMGLLAFNIAHGVPVPKSKTSSVNKSTKRVLLTADEANRLIATANGHELKAAIFITICFGLRKSELLGLRWQAIDFDNNTLKINYTVVKMKTLIEKERTKNASSEAVFELFPEAKRVLFEVKRQIEENEEAFGKSYKKSDFVFVKPDGERYTPNTIYQLFAKFLRDQGLPHMRWHDLRHSCASVLYDRDWDMKAIQEWMRHSDASMTSHYTKLSKRRQIIMSEEINRTFVFDE